jgi:hypothetical protein
MNLGLLLEHHFQQSNKYKALRSISYMALLLLIIARHDSSKDSKLIQQ